MNTVVGIAVTNMIPVTRDISQLAVFPNMARIRVITNELVLLRFLEKCTKHRLSNINPPTD